MSYLLLLRAHWKLIGIGLLVLLLGVQSVRLGNAHNRIDRLKIDNNELRAELKSISDAKDRQRAETEKRIDKAEKQERDAKPIADKIRNAPLPPNCATPGLDLLRNEV